MGFDPVTLGTIAAVSGVLGVGVSAYSAVAQGNAASKAASYQAQVARNNQTIASQNARHASQVGEAEALNAGLKGAAKVGAARAAFAANNVDVNSGSALDVISGEAATGRQDQLTVANNAAEKVYGYRTQGSNFGATAGLEDAESTGARNAGALGAAGTLLGNASSIGFKWQQMQEPGGTWAGNDGSQFSASGLG